jgi:hypothetical protein
MHSQTENRDLILRNVRLIILVLFILFVFKNASSGHDEPVNKIAATEQISNVNSAAVPVFPVTFRSPDNKLVTCDIWSFGACSDKKLRIISSNSAENSLLRNCRERFIEIKPQILTINFHHIRTSLDDEEIVLIS